MSPDYKDKCLVCLKTGGNFNIFTTYNKFDEKEELYVDVIKNCFNIEITKDSGLHEMCTDCSLKLRHSYIFRHSIIGAVNKVVLAKVSESSDAKSFTDVDYLEEIPFDNNYEVDPVQDEPEQIPDTDKMSDTEVLIFGLDNNRDVGGETKNLQVDNVRETDGKIDSLNEDTAETDTLLNLDGRAKTDSMLNLEDTAQKLDAFNLDDRAQTDSLLNLNYEVNPVQDEPEQIPDLDKMSDTEDYCIFGLDNNRDVGDETKNLQVDNVRESDSKIDLLNEDTAKTDSLLNLDDSVKNVSLLDLDDATLIPFNIEKEANHDPNEIPYFMDLDNVLQVNMHITNDVMKEKEDILNGHDEPYSLSILNENDLNTFLMEEGDMKVLDIGGNSFKDIAKDDNDMNPETALSTDGSYIPFVFNHEIDKNAFIKVADITVKNVDNGNKTKPKATRIVVRKKGKKTDVVENSVNDYLEKNNENKTNVNTAVDNLATKESQPKAKKASKRKVDNLAEKESQPKAKKTNKRKAKSNAVEEGTGIIAQKIDDNKTDSSMGNDLLEKEVKGKKGKKTARKGKKAADTVKENVPGEGEDVKPKKRRRKEPVGDTATPPPTMPGPTACTVCDAQFETTAELSAHVKTHPPEFICLTCGQKFDRKTKFTIHMRTHNNGPFYCKFCKQEFAKINTRNTHEWRVHSKPEPFKCSHCGERFKTFLKRLRHLQVVHQDNTQYPCGFCEKTFAYSAYRTKHIEIIHLNKREYKCEKCPAAFARRGALDGHMASKHGIGDMKYECHLCDRKFFVQTALRWHVSAIHNRHSCNVCGEKFGTSAALEQHAKMHDKADLDISLGIDFSTLPLEEYGIMDSNYFDLNELEV